MSSSTLDYRKPEQQLDKNHSHYAKIQKLGEQYRAAKKQLKIQTEEKKTLSKQVAIAKQKNDDAEATIINIQHINEQIKWLKNLLKTTEQNIDTLLNGHSDNKTITAPQFSKPPQPTKLNIDEIIISTSNDDSAWQTYIEKHPNATVYHSLATRNVITKAFGHQHRLLEAHHNGTICGVLPLYRLQSKLFGDLWCSVPFFNYGGVIADNNDIANKLLTAANDYVDQHGGQHIEYRHSQTQLPQYPCRDEKVTMLLELPQTVEALSQQLGAKLRAQIKKTDEHALTTATGRQELINDFYQVFARNMRDLGTPVYSKKLFINMLAEHPSASITIVYHNKKPVSAGFTLGWRNTLEIPWASTIKSANKYNANMRLYWQILQNAIEQGYEVFDFGRSSKDASTYKFKKQWGAKPHQLHWHYWLAGDNALPSINNNNPKYQLAIKVWQRLPIWLSKLMGPHIVKYIP